MVDDLHVAQKDLIEENMKVEKTLKKIVNSTTSTGDSLHKMTDTMNVINTGGKEINQFIAMIDDISDRINLLSLNAAIEAARAAASPLSLTRSESSPRPRLTTPRRPPARYPGSSPTSRPGRASSPTRRNRPT
ncbi:MAG TPA: methyl-accepting chemotaxis protein [Spirochaetota bacterium]|nr:methyl-accepting chemotaxis protein [Spirochaetota bacterium]